MAGIRASPRRLGESMCASRASGWVGKVSGKVEDAIRTHLRAGNGILKVAAMVGVGSGTVQWAKRDEIHRLDHPPVRQYKWLPNPIQ